MNPALKKQKPAVKAVPMKVEHTMESFGPNGSKGTHATLRVEIESTSHGKKNQEVLVAMATLAAAGITDAEQLRGRTIHASLARKRLGLEVEAISL